MGLGLDYLSIGTGNDEMDCKADFTMTVIPGSIQLSFDILFTRETPWVNPFMASPLLEVLFPIELGFGVSFFPPPVPPAPAYLNLAGGIGAIPDERYSDEMTFYAVLVADLVKPKNSGFLLELENFKLGRVLYTLAGYLAQIIAGSPGSPVSLVLDFLDLCRVDHLHASINPSPMLMCTKGGNCIEPGAWCIIPPLTSSASPTLHRIGIHLNVTNLDFFGLIVRRRVATCEVLLTSPAGRSVRDSRYHRSYPLHFILGKNVHAQGELWAPWYAQ
jgi:hypothetical protein